MNLAFTEEVQIYYVDFIHFLTVFSYLCFLLMFDHDHFADDDEDERVTIPVSEEDVKDIYNDVMKVEKFFSELNIR